MATKMSPILIIGVIAVIWIISQGGIGGTGGSGGDGTDADGQCFFQPSVELLTEDKYDASITGFSASHRYKKNGGPTQTYSTTFNAKAGDTIEVMYGAGNATYANSIESFEVDCGVNTETGKIVRNTSMTIECFDENNDIINDLDDNFTMGTGETATVACRLKLDNSKAGIPHGGVLYVELASGTVYKEEQTSVSGGIIGSRNSGVESAYTLSAAANKVLAFDVNPLETTGYQTFNIIVEAESAQDPGVTNDLTLTLYPKLPFENGDTGAFETGVVDEDNVFVGSPQGSETISME